MQATLVVHPKGAPAAKATNAKAKPVVEAKKKPANKHEAVVFVLSKRRDDDDEDDESCSCSDGITVLTTPSGHSFIASADNAYDNPLQLLLPEHWSRAELCIDGVPVASASATKTGVHHNVLDLVQLYKAFLPAV